MSLEQYEAAANITFSIDGVEIPVQSVDLTKDVDIEQIRENNIRPIGFAVTEIEYQGTISFTGNGYVNELDIDFSESEDFEEGDVDHLEEFFTDGAGIPKDGANVTIFHENNNKQTAYENVMVISDGYETETSDVSGISFEVIASNRTREDVDGE